MILGSEVRVMSLGFGIYGSWFSNLWILDLNR
jgi:hypothetical protein